MLGLRLRRRLILRRTIRLRLRLRHGLRLRLDLRRMLRLGIRLRRCLGLLRLRLGLSCAHPRLRRRPELKLSLGLA